MAIEKIPTGVRHPDWERRLFALIEQRKDAPFVWGQFDCCTWGAMCVEAVTGQPVTLNERKRKDEKSAARLVKTLGGMREILTALLGEPIDVKMARRGDLCLLSDGNRNTIGVCIGADIVCPDTDGLKNIPTLKAGAAWRL